MNFPMEHGASRKLDDYFERTGATQAGLRDQAMRLRPRQSCESQASELAVLILKVGLIVVILVGVTAILWLLMWVLLVWPRSWTASG
jgi:hypothetical protein